MSPQRCTLYVWTGQYYIEIGTFIYSSLDKRAQLINQCYQHSARTVRPRVLVPTSSCIFLIEGSILGEGTSGKVVTLRSWFVSNDLPRTAEFKSAVEKLLQGLVLKVGKYGQEYDWVAFKREQKFLNEYYQTSSALSFTHSLNQITLTQSKNIRFLMPRIGGVGLNQLLRNDQNYFGLISLFQILFDSVSIKSPAFIGFGSYLARLHEFCLRIHLLVFKRLAELGKKYSHGDFKPANLMVSADVDEFLKKLKEHFSNSSARRFTEKFPDKAAVLPVDFSWTTYIGYSVLTTPENCCYWPRCRKNDLRGEKSLQYIAKAWHDIYSYVYIVSKYCTYFSLEKLFHYKKVKRNKLSAEYFIHQIEQALQAKEYDAVYYLATHPLLLEKLLKPTGNDKESASVTLLRKNFLYPVLISELLYRDKETFELVLTAAKFFRRVITCVESSPAWRQFILEQSFKPLQQQLKALEKKYKVDISFEAGVLIEHCADINRKLDNQVRLGIARLFGEALKQEIVRFIKSKRKYQLVLPFLTQSQLRDVMLRLPACRQFSVLFNEEQVSAYARKAGFLESDIRRMIEELRETRLTQQDWFVLRACIAAEELAALQQQFMQQWLQNVSLKELLLITSFENSDWVSFFGNNPEFATFASESDGFVSRLSLLSMKLNYRRFVNASDNWFMLDAKALSNSLKQQHNLQKVNLCVVKKMQLASAEVCFYQLLEKFEVDLPQLEQGFNKAYWSICNSGSGNRVQKVQELVFQCGFIALVQAACVNEACELPEALKHSLSCLQRGLSEGSLQSLCNAIVKQENSGQLIEQIFLQAKHVSSQKISSLAKSLRLLAKIYNSRTADAGLSAFWLQSSESSQAMAATDQLQLSA
jgi:serine/threonine protein kinase